MPTRRISRNDALYMAKYCASSNLRRIARIVSRHYERELRTAGVTTTQMPILAAISAGAGASIGTLAEALDLERSTVSRDVSTLVRRKLVVLEAGEDRRVTTLQLTEEGHRVLVEALAAWRRAHNAMLRRFGEDAYEDLLDAANRLGSSVDDNRQRARRSG